MSIETITVKDNQRKWMDLSKPSDFEGKADRMKNDSIINATRSPQRPGWRVVWYSIVEFNVPLDTVQVISETGGPEQWCASLIQ